MNIHTNSASTDGRVQDRQSRHGSPALAPASDVHAGPINILVVDDEPKNLTVLETVLDNPNYRLVRAESADQALGALVAEEFALLILDIRMPDMTGFELAKIIKQRKKTAGVPIIFLTAFYNEDPHVLEGYGSGAVDYLVKPVNPAILRSKVAIFAELHRKSRALLAEVTERRRAEEQLRELNDTLEQRVAERTQALQKTSAALHETGERYRSLFEGSLDAIFFLGADEHFHAANPTALRFFARTIEELKTVPFLDLCAPGQRETVGDVFRAAFQRQGFTIDTAVMTVTGERRDLFISGAPAIHDGEVVGISCIARDITERIQTEKALRLSESRYRELIEALPAAIYTTDRHGRIQLYNQAAVALWGRQPEVGKDVWCGSWKIYKPDGTLLPLDQCPMAIALREGRAIRDVEILIERPDRTRRHVLPHPEPIYTDGAVVGAINMLIDITDRKEAEKSIARLAAIVTSSDDAIIGKDLRGIVTSWNGAAERLFGYTAEEMIGQPVLQLIPPERKDEESYILAQIAQGEPVNHYETVRLCKNGTELTVSLTVSPIFAEGKIIGASKIVRDVTDRKRAERALLDSREQLRHILEFKEAVLTSMGEGVYTVNEQGLVTSINQAAATLFGYTCEELIGRKMHDVVHYKHRDGTPFGVEECAGYNVLRGATPLTNYEDVFIRKDGTFFNVVYSSSPIVAGGKIAGLVVVFQDISERKRAEEALLERDRSLTTVNEALKQQTIALAEANKDLEKFSYSVSHDLRAPLRTIDAFSRIVEEDHGPRLNEEGRRSLTIVRKAVGQAGELIDDLLEFSKLGRQGMNFRPVNMADLAREAVDDLKLLQEGRQIDLTIGDLPSCQGDRRFLKLVWINLLTNAFKYTKNRKETRVEIGWMPDDTDDKMVIYFVKDNGIGFSMKYVHKLFEVFQRLHRQEDFEGTGVGLAVVQRIVRRHDGRVWAEGKVDDGARFYFSLRKAMP